MKKIIQNKSPLLRPWERPYLQVGDEALNFDNQLVADISEVKEENESYEINQRAEFQRVCHILHSEEERMEFLKKLKAEELSF